MKFDAEILERTAQAFRADMWGSVGSEALQESGFAERHFGPIQANVIQALPDEWTLNTVLGAAEEGAVAGGHLAEAIEWADSLGVDYRIGVGQDRPETAAAEQLLELLGFEQGIGFVRYARDAMEPPDLPEVPGVTVWQLAETEGEEALAFETMVLSAAPVLGLHGDACELLGTLPMRDRWRCYTVELEERIIAFGSMLIHDRVAAIGLEATAPRARNRGCQRALLNRRIRVAREAGCETLFTDVPSYGEELGAAVGNLVRAGFVPAHRSVNWQRPR